MLTQNILRELFLYIQANYKAQAYDRVDYGENLTQVKSGDSKYPDGESISLDNLLKEVGKSFHEMLFEQIHSSGMTDVEIYKRANIDRKLFSKIRSNPAYHPRKQTVLALAIALKLSLNETIDLLARAEYALSPGSKGDLIVKYFIEHKVYDIRTINSALEEYNQPTLD